MIKPKRLRFGDTLAVVSPSAGLAKEFPHIFDGGLETLRQVFGFSLREFPTARMGSEDLYRHPELRAEDINKAFADRDIDGIVCSIGGDDSIRILEYLDMDLIMKNPKLIMGYSDSTTFLNYLNAHGLVTYYGSSVMAGFSHLRCFPEAVEEYKRTLFTDLPYRISAFPRWAERYKNWKQPENAGEVQELHTDDVGHRWIHKSSRCEGMLWGGCIEVLNMMNGTFAWPGADFFKDRILMLETSEDKPTPAYVGYSLRNFGIQGILQNLRGIMVAKPKAYSNEEKAELDGEVKRIVIDEFGCVQANIITNVEFGHTEPRHIMPLGIRLSMDPEREMMEFVEPLFSS